MGNRIGPEAVDHRRVRLEQFGDGPALGETEPHLAQTLHDVQRGLRGVGARLGRLDRATNRRADHGIRCVRCRPSGQRLRLLPAPWRQIDITRSAGVAIVAVPDGFSVAGQRKPNPTRSVARDLDLWMVCPRTRIGVHRTPPPWARAWPASVASSQPRSTSSSTRAS